MDIMDLVVEVAMVWGHPPKVILFELLKVCIDSVFSLTSIKIPSDLDSAFPIT